MLLGILPERAIEGAHADAGSLGERSAGLGVLPPVGKVVGRWLIDAQRTQGTEVEDRVRVRMREVKDDRRGGPANATQQRQDLDAKLFARGGEGSVRYLAYVL